MWQIVLVLISFSFASVELENKVYQLIQTKPTLESVKDFYDKELKIKKKIKDDSAYYFHYDLKKSVEVILKNTKMTKTACDQTRVSIYSDYNVKDMNNPKADLPKGAMLSIKLINSMCK